MASENSENYPGKLKRKTVNKLTILKKDIDKSLQTAAALRYKVCLHLSSLKGVK